MEHISTLETFDNLVASGIPAEQARAHVYSLNRSLDRLATKDDLNRLGMETKQDIKNFEEKLENKIDLVESKLEAKLDSKFNLIFTLGGIMFAAHTLPILDKIKEVSPTNLSIAGGIAAVVIWVITYFSNRKK